MHGRSSFLFLFFSFFFPFFTGSKEAETVALCITSVTPILYLYMAPYFFILRNTGIYHKNRYVTYEKNNFNRFFYFLSFTFLEKVPSSKTNMNFQLHASSTFLVLDKYIVRGVNRGVS